MSKQQTAMQQFIYWYKKPMAFHLPHEIESKFKEILAIEKEQILDAHRNGKSTLPPNENAVQYFNETYAK